MDLKTARQRLLDAIDVLHDGQGLDALRLQERIDELIRCHLREWKRRGCMRDLHSCEYCADCADDNGSKS